jgi:hypothetical protein
MAKVVDIWYDPIQRLPKTELSTSSGAPAFVGSAQSIGACRFSERTFGWDGNCTLLAKRRLEILHGQRFPIKQLQKAGPRNSRESVVLVSNPSPALPVAPAIPAIALCSQLEPRGISRRQRDARAYLV